jgi:hypothetical protein
LYLNTTQKYIQMSFYIFLSFYKYDNEEIAWTDWLVEHIKWYVKSSNNQIIKIIQRFINRSPSCKWYLISINIKICTPWLADWMSTIKYLKYSIREGKFLFKIKFCVITQMVKYAFGPLNMYNFICIVPMKISFEL